MTAAAMPAHPVLDAALAYAKRGLEVFPCKPNKAPYTPNGMKDATTDPATIRAWWARWPDALVAARIPKDRVVLDVDPRHGGDQTWKFLEDAYGPIHAGRRHKSGRGDGGTHQWFIRPPGTLSIGKLNEFARANGVGHAVGQRSWSSGIDLLHHDHRYSILPPSPHPDTGDPYTWDTKGAPAEMPPWLVELITADEPAPRPTPAARLVVDENSIADWYSANHSWHDILRPLGWQLAGGDGDSDGSLWRHPNASAPHSASVKHGCLFVYSPNTDFDETAPNDPRGYTRFRAYTLTQHGGDGKAAARAAYELRDGPRDWSDPLADAARIAAEAPVVPVDGLNLPDEWWNARPVLQHIRQAAHARQRSADAVLLVTLARYACYYPPDVKLPAIVGSTASLNMLAAIVASSGAGKSTCNSVAAELVPLDDRPETIADIPMGSGEGLIELYFEMVDEEQPDGKNKRVKRQTRRCAFMYLDEGEALAEMGNRKGATLLPTLRSAWAGTVLGQANASQETFRHLKAHSYRLSIVVGFQFKYAHQLLTDSAGGTPQRFVYATTHDPNVPDEPPEWPGPLQVPHVTTYRNMDELVSFDETIVAEIRKTNVQAVRGEIQIAEMDSHRNLVCMKVAAILALLDNDRRRVTVDDWRLAGELLDCSDRVRAAVVEYGRLEARKAAEQRIRSAVDTTLAVESSKHDQAVRRGARAIARRVARAGEPVGRGDVSRAVRGTDKQLATIDEMIDWAVAEQWIEPALEGWRKGRRDVA